ALFFFLLNDFDSYMHFNSAYFHQGTRLYLHDPDTLPTDDGILIVPGHSQRINFKAVVTHLLKQKRNCREQEFYEYMYDTSLQETRRIKLDYSLCKVLVSARKYHSRCRCYTPFLPAFKFDDSKPQLCFNMSVFNSSQLIQNALCLAEVHKEYSNEELFKATIDRECAHVKEVLCVRTEYNIESSDYMWPELWSEKMNSARKQLMQTVATNIVSRKYPDWTFDELLEFVQNNMSIKELSQLLRTDCSDAHIKARSVYSDKVS
uniref:Mab-21 domain-containing protein n=3 Tax=Macrostomum lignano TaxID=282301 RepID=A0A1I8GIM8_9PLAT